MRVALLQLLASFIAVGFDHFYVAAGQWLLAAAAGAAVLLDYYAGNAYLRLHATLLVRYNTLCSPTWHVRRMNNRWGKRLLLFHGGTKTGQGEGWGQGGAFFKD